jgi:hypothetical protein
MASLPAATDLKAEAAFKFTMHHKFTALQTKSTQCRVRSFSNAKADSLGPIDPRPMRPGGNL